MLLKHVLHSSLSAHTCTSSPLSSTAVERASTSVIEAITASSKILWSVTTKELAGIVGNVNYWGTQGPKVAQDIIFFVEGRGCREPVSPQLPPSSDTKLGRCRFYWFTYLSVDILPAERRTAEWLNLRRKPHVVTCMTLFHIVGQLCWPGLELIRQIEHVHAIYPTVRGCIYVLHFVNRTR